MPAIERNNQLLNLRLRLKVAETFAACACIAGDWKAIGYHLLQIETAESALMSLGASPLGMR